MGKRGKVPANKLPVATAYPSEVAKPYKPSKEDEARERRYRCEDGLRTIQRAEEVKKDKSLMNDIKAYAKEQAKAVGAIK